MRKKSVLMPIRFFPVSSMADHMAVSFHLDVEDLDYTPFDARGGRGKMWELFGDETESLIDELNEVLAA